MSDSEDISAIQTVNTPTKRKRHVILSDAEEEPATREVPLRQLPPRDEAGEPRATVQPTRACAPRPMALVRGRHVDFVVGANVIVWYIMDEKCPDKKTAFSGKVLSYLPQQRGQQRHGLKVYFEEDGADYWVDEDGVDEWCWQEELEEIEAKWRDRATGLPASELISILKARGVSMEGLLDKSELVELVVQTGGTSRQQRAATQPQPQPAQAIGDDEVDDEVEFVGERTAEERQDQRAINAINLVSDEEDAELGFQAVQMSAAAGEEASQEAGRAEERRRKGEPQQEQEQEECEEIEPHEAKASRLRLRRACGDYDLDASTENLTQIPASRLRPRRGTQAAVPSALMQLPAFIAASGKMVAAAVSVAAARRGVESYG